MHLTIKLEIQLCQSIKKYNIENIIENCNQYAIENGEKIFIEYVLLKDVNDTEQCAKELSKIMSQFPCKLNFIQFNPWPESNTNLYKRANL